MDHPETNSRSETTAESVFDIIERRICIVHDLSTSTGLVTLRNNDMAALLLLSSRSVLTHRLLLDLNLVEKQVALFLLDRHLLHRVVFIVVVELANSPVGRVVVTHLLRHLLAELLVEIGVLDLVASLRILVLGRRNQAGAKSVRLRLNLHLGLSCLLFS